MVDKKIVCNALPMRFLKTIRDSRGLSQYEMATFLGLRPQTYFYYEKKAQGINLSTLADIRKRLKLSWQELGSFIEEEVSEQTKQEATNRDKRK